ncbi:MAG TPA: ribosomal L7Ae/L30e/S12e/Gadd45 family protein [Selenomonadales bacterium]|nr:ribosomal L7Ae/L30e/S12e/Gadd45 family protein [Selenomonadales bacterium]
MNEQKLRTLLGLAQKAGKLASGELAVEKAVKSGKAKLVLIAADASDNTRKSYRDMTSYYKIACHETLSKDQLGNATGKPPRAAVAVTESGFAKAMSEALLS